MKTTILYAFCAVCCLSAHAATKPNIVVLVSDDAGYNEFSMLGAKHFPTPRIDSIAANGVRFAQGYTSGTVCSPTRAGLLTGRYQNRFGHEFNVPPAYNESNGLSLAETTLADVLKGAGYRTIALGKWHLGYAPKFHPMARGFTDYSGFLQGARSYFPLENPTRLNQLLRDRDPVAEKFDYMTDELARAAAEYITKHKAEPFARQWPAVLPKGKVFTHPVISLDIFPTALTAAGVEKSPGKPLDGVNLVPFLTGTAAARPHQTLYWKNGTKWAVRDGDLKLTAGNNEGRKAAGKSQPAPALFDLTADQGESTDLAAKRPEDIARLTKLHEDWKRDFPKPTWGGGAKEEAE